MRDMLLALGLLLSPASQLRPVGSPVGPGEICFAAWLAISAIRNLGRTDIPLTNAAWRILAFWLLFAIALSIGTLTAFLTTQHNDPALMKHDIQAYILVAGIGFFCVLEPTAPGRLKHIAWLLSGLGTVFLGMQWAEASGLAIIPGLDPWYWDRLRGWSENPNQLALVCLVIGLVSLHLAETAERSRETVAALGCAVLPLVVGLMTKSDSFLLILAVGCPLLIALKIRNWLRADASRPSVRNGLAWCALLALPIILVLAAPAAMVAAGNSTGFEKEFTQNNRDALERDAPERLKLWKQALELGVGTGMLGLGPGPHLVREQTASISYMDGRAYERHPSDDPRPDFESHNTVLDLFTQGGLLAVLAFGWLFGTALLLAVRTRHDSLAVLLCGLAVFSVFHLIVRHPLLWFVLALTLVAAAPARSPAATGDRI